MNKKKTILAAVVLLLLFAVGGAIAYFTDTDTKTNTFTIGNVDIELEEPHWSTTDTTPANGVPDVAENLMPGQTIAKDPTINNLSTKNPAYVFAKVEVPCTTAVSPATPEEIFTYTINDDKWTELTTSSLPVACTSAGTATHVYYYGTNGTLTALAKAADSSTPTPTDKAVFDNVTLRNTLTGNEGLTGNKQIVVTGYGIQTLGLASTTPADVWANFS